jgi:meiotic recombination protein SPO11
MSSGSRRRREAQNSTLEEHITGKESSVNGKFAAVQKLRTSLRGSQAGAKLPHGVKLVTEKDTEKLHEEIHALMRTLIKEIGKGNPPSLELPLRGSGNIIWDEENDLLLLGEKTTIRSLGSLRTAKDVTRLIRVLEIVHELLEKNIHATKREIFYNDVNLFGDQRQSDNTIDDIGPLLGTNRESTHIVASAKGTVLGRLVLEDSGDRIDCTRLGTGGWSITPFLDHVEIVESDAEFLLIVEKDAAMLRLSEVKWWNKYPCILLTAKGSPDIASRIFARRLAKELKLPAFTLVDADPFGHYIHSVYLRGSKRLSYESPFLATPELKLLGVLGRDLDQYNIPKECRLRMTPQDIKRAKAVMDEPFVAQNPKWVADIRLMVKRKEKAEIQALSSHGFEFLAETYLPTKLETGDWI